MDSPAKASSAFMEVLEHVKNKAIKQGTWNRDPENESVKKTKAAKRPKHKPDPHRHSNFIKIYPGLFSTPGLWMVYDLLWRRSKKTRTGKLRWAGYIRDVAIELNRSYSQTRRDFKTLEGKKIIHRWNTGKRFPENIKTGTGPKFHQTILTLCWNPADFKRQRILEKKAARKRAREDRPCLNS